MESSRGGATYGTKKYEEYEDRIFFKSKITLLSYEVRITCGNRQNTRRWEHNFHKNCLL